MKISDELRQHIQDNPNIQEVHFNKRGQHFFNAYPFGRKLFARLRHEFEELKEDYEIVETWTRERILHHKHHHGPKTLRAIYETVDASGNIVFDNLNNNSMAAQTITVLPNQNTVPGQLVPVAADGVTVEPISTINAGSEVYTSSNPAVATVAAVTGGTEGQFAVTRVAGQSGTVVITYAAVNTAGTTITNAGGVGDTFIFQGQPTGVAAALTATFGTPS